MSRSIIKYLFLLSFAYVSVNAQDIKKDVTVVKPYEPTVQNASKINILPSFNDTATIRPVFEYKISPVRLDLTFQPRPVPAAKMAQEPLKRLYNNYVKLGYGTPFSPLAVISVSNGRNKENAGGIFIRHHSANGEIKLNDNMRVDAPFSDNEVNLYGQHAFRKSVLSGDIFYTGNKITFYGIDPAVNKVYDKKDYTQNYHKTGFRVNLQSTHNDSDKMIISTSAGFRYLSDDYEHVENNFNLQGNAGKKVNNFFFGASGNIDYYKPGSGNDDSIFNTIVDIRPYLSKKSDLWRFELGLGFTFDADQDETKFLPYPSALLEFNIAPSVLKAFIQFRGHLESNNLDKIRLENPYIIPGLRVKNTNYKSQLYGGFKGSFSESLNFLATLTYSNIENQYFFINDTLAGGFHNYFQVVYDNIDKVQVAAEIDYSLNDKWNILAKGNFYNYTTFRQSKAWHLPNFDASLGLKYNLRSKIILSSEAYLVGERYAKQAAKTITLDPFVDVNLGIEYRYSKLLSAFVQIRNLTAARYHIWNQYPTYRFQAMAGFTYMF